MRVRLALDICADAGLVVDMVVGVASVEHAKDLQDIAVCRRVVELVASSIETEDECFAWPFWAEYGLGIRWIASHIEAPALCQRVYDTGLIAGDVGCRGRAFSVNSHGWANKSLLSVNDPGGAKEKSK